MMAATASRAATPVRRRKKTGLTRTESRWGWLLAAPVIGGFGVFTLGPMIASGVLSFSSWTIGGKVHLNGIGNYQHMFFHDAEFAKSLWVTSYYTLAAVPAGLIVAFIAAALLNQKVRGQSIFRTIFYLPTVMPLVASAMLWIWMFNPDFGLLDQLLRSAHLPTNKWIYDENTAVPSLVLMTTWGFGNSMVIFLAGLQGVPNHLYEAIEVDGGGALAKFRHITFPMMTPTIFYNVVTGFIAAIQVFVQAAVMTQGTPNNSTLFYVYYLYRTAFSDGQLGYACALAWILFLIVLVVTFALFRSARHWVYYELGTAR